MKGVSGKKLLKSIALSTLLYLLGILLVSLLTMKGVLGEERLALACAVCAGVTAFVSAFVYRLGGKDASFLGSVLCGGGFFPLALLVGFLIYGELSLEQTFMSLAAVLVGLAAANVLYAKAGFGRKKRGRGRGANK